jgi:hypothetical protein
MILRGFVVLGLDGTTVHPAHSDLVVSILIFCRSRFQEAKHGYMDVDER